MKEFNLSDKMETHETRLYADKWFHEDDIKEFIKLLKKELVCNPQTCGCIGGYDCLRCSVYKEIEEKINILSEDKLK